MHHQKQDKPSVLVGAGLSVALLYNDLVTRANKYEDAPFL